MCIFCIMEEIEKSREKDIESSKNFKINWNGKNINIENIINKSLSEESFNVFINSFYGATGVKEIQNLFLNDYKRLYENEIKKCENDEMIIGNLARENKELKEKITELTDMLNREFSKYVALRKDKQKEEFENKLKDKTDVINHYANKIQKLKEEIKNLRMINFEKHGEMFTAKATLKNFRNGIKGILEEYND